MDDRLSNKIVAAILTHGIMNDNESDRTSHNYLAVYQGMFQKLEEDRLEQLTAEAEERKKQSEKTALAWAEAARRLNEQI